MHIQFVEPSKRYADVIIPEGGHNLVSIDLISGKIRERLASSMSLSDDGRSSVIGGQG
jgi:uridine kinase